METFFTFCDLYLLCGAIVFVASCLNRYLREGVVEMDEGISLVTAFFIILIMWPIPLIQMWMDKSSRRKSCIN